MSSSKGSKRRQKRINTIEEETEVEKKSSPSKKIEEEIQTSNDVIIIDVENDTKEDREEKNDLKGFDSTEIPDNIITLETNGKEEPEIKTNGERSVSESVATDSQKSSEGDVEIEPLVLDSDNDPELQFPSETGSDISLSEPDKSPVLANRCSTRRSHTRNAPTPRTPKSEVNGMLNDVRVKITRMDVPDIIVSSPEEIVTNSSVTSADDTFESVDKTETDDVTNASIFVNYDGNDTRNVDITTTSVLEDTVSQSFVETTKDLSYGEALRNLSGRRTLRSSLHHNDLYRSRFCKSSLELKDTTDSRKSYIPHISSVKRKGLGETPDDSKRFKTSDDVSSPGLLSYIASPINSFKNKVGRSEIPSSTPKLMSFKFSHHQGTNIIDEVSKLDLDDEKSEPKKWCSIM